MVSLSRNSAAVVAAALAAALILLINIVAVSVTLTQQRNDSLRSRDDYHTNAANAIAANNSAATSTSASTTTSGGTPLGLDLDSVASSRSITKSSTGSVSITLGSGGYELEHDDGSDSSSSGQTGEPARGETTSFTISLPTVHECTQTGEPTTILVTEGTTEILLQRAPELYVCGLALQVGQGDDETFIYIARSYYELDWEITGGQFASRLPAPACTATYCRVYLGTGGQVLPELIGRTLIMPSVERRLYSKRDSIARFLERTTFGGTMDEIKQIEQLMDTTTPINAYAKWVKNQQDNIPIMSHRAIFRRHANDQLIFPSPISDVGKPCRAGTRFRRGAFTSSDSQKTLEIKVFGSENKRALYVDGQLRTIVGSGPLYTERFKGGPIIEKNWRPGFYTMCNQERVGAGNFFFEIRVPNSFNCEPFLVKEPGTSNYYTNPPVEWKEEDLAQLEPNGYFEILDIPDDAAGRVDQKWFDYINQLGDSFTTPWSPEIILNRDLAVLQDNDPICMALRTDNEYYVPWIAKWRNTFYLYDYRAQLQDNDMMNPAEDGGGKVFREHFDALGDGSNPMCSNVFRNFINEDYCRISSSPDVCTYRNFQLNQKSPVMFDVTAENIRAINEATQADESHKNFYLYAIEGLDINKDPVAPKPCTPGAKSSWISVPCEAASISRIGNVADPSTGQFFLDSLLGGQGNNPFLTEITHDNVFESYCHPADVDRVDFQIRDPETNRCWKNVHPDHLSIFDFEQWRGLHPGGAAPIAPAEAGSVTLTFPSWHELSRWEGNKNKIPSARMKLGDRMNFFRLPPNLRTGTVAEALGIEPQVSAALTASEASSVNLQNNILVCGSPNEVANDPFLGGTWGRGAFTMQGKSVGRVQPRAEQRQTIWFIAALNDPGQLRQRAAWALSQILCISPSDLQGKDNSEPFLNYYDIFIRHAFGNYRDVLKEVSYSPVMGDMLSYIQGQSTAYTLWQKGKVLFADENYAREIMQLFTTGLVRLNRNGTEVYDADGETSLVYTNDDIEEYARAWTGFGRSHRRGNMDVSDDNQNILDPMRLVGSWRDPFPKMGLDGQYIGDGYPLCTDLPSKHFLARGATYVLLGGIATPESQKDPAGWNVRSALKLSLVAASPLHQKLCSPSDNGECVFKNKVVLDQALDCYGQECLIDTVRSLEVAGVFYEYIRPPCVHQLFYDDASTVVRRPQREGATTHRLEAMCANPRTESASVGCVDPNNWRVTFWVEQYFGERTLLSTAESRCDSLASPDRRTSCAGTESSRCEGDNHMWTTRPCVLKAKIDKVTGRVGIVHQPQDVDDRDVFSHVRSRQPTFFRVEFEEGYDGELQGCEALESCTLTEDDKCLCDVTVSEVQVFEGYTTPSKHEILASLRVGAFELEEPPHSSNEDVKVYRRGTFGSLSKDSIFEVVDDFGKRHLRKNVKLLVQISGTNLAFRNPVHFLNLADQEARDAQYETDATLDHYFFHQNTAPFLAIRFAQRFGISNPSPRYVHAIATAFITGHYTSTDGRNQQEHFGSGTYGDLAATFAAVLLDREGLWAMLDADPTYGSMKEPLIKLVSLMRALEFRPNQNPFTWAWFKESAPAMLVGQWPHTIPSVFSFFLPEFSPKGKLGMSSLVSPEAQVMTGPRIIDTLNSFYSLFKFGLNGCDDGLGPEVGSCEIGDKDQGVGYLTYEPESSGDDVVDELATLMTAGRLSANARDHIKEIYANSNRRMARIKAQMLIATTPEFHSYGTVNLEERKRRNRPAPTASETPYKALVVVYLTGGMDSYNMLAPHRCTEKNAVGQTLREQYDAERGTIALKDSQRTRIIDASDQPCSKFAIHPDLRLVERLYKNGELSFFANAGHMEAPVTKDNYNSVTSAQLFAHNVMQKACYETDPKQAVPGTGILGRMGDMLLAKGFKAQSLTVDDETAATIGVNLQPLVAPTSGLQKFTPTIGEGNDRLDLTSHIDVLNNATKLRSSLYGDTWSRKLRAAIDDSNFMADAFDKATLTQTYPKDIVTSREHPRIVETLSKIVLTHQDRGSDRDVIFVPMGSWDHHSQLDTKSKREFQRLDGALTLFEKEMKEQGLWDKVTVVIASDFGRTLTPNSNEGSDHAWGGNYFMFGGSVKGGKIHGDYPADITLNGGLNLGRGRLLPTMSWESILTSTAEWMGLDTDEELDYVLPNRAGTGAKIFSMNEVFN